jgi:hypothetical protein
MSRLVEFANGAFWNSTFIQFIKDMQQVEICLGHSDGQPLLERRRTRLLCPPPLAGWALSPPPASAVAAAWQGKRREKVWLGFRGASKIAQAGESYMDKDL